jgi:hypothetical protein
MTLSEERSSAMAFWTGAKSYLDAANFLNTAYLDDRLSLAYDDPVLFLVGHAAELTFKAHLRASGQSLKDLIGHDLVALHEEACANNLPISLSEFEKQHLVLLNNLHGLFPYQTRYPVTGSYTAPSAKVLIGALDKMLSAILSTCVQAARS